MIPRVFRVFVVRPDGAVMGLREAHVLSQNDETPRITRTVSSDTHVA
jgi:hypothetical protein